MKSINKNLSAGTGSGGCGTFDIPYYQGLKKYLIFLGQYPSQTDSSVKMILIVHMISVVSFATAAVLQFYISIRNKDWDAALETLPYLVTILNGFGNFVTLNSNRRHLKTVFIAVENEWRLQVDTADMHRLNEITGRGSKIAQVYRNTLLLVLVVYMATPLLNPMLDVVLPLNETRTRKQVFDLYYFVNKDEHFFSIYLHLYWCVIIGVVGTVTEDSLTMVITYHASALFAICGHKITKVTETNDLATIDCATKDYGYQQIRECVITHNKAIQFFEILDQMNRMHFLRTVGLNIIGISVTAYLVILHLHETLIAVQYILFFCAQYVHLFFINLPGQILTEYSSKVAENIYCSKWYQTSVQIQKVLNLMQIRACRPCMITAGGMCTMNIENFGVVFKTCISYCTMLLSMRE